MSIFVKVDFGDILFEKDVTRIGETGIRINGLVGPTYFKYLYKNCIEFKDYDFAKYTLNSTSIETTNKPKLKKPKVSIFVDGVIISRKEIRNMEKVNCFYALKYSDINYY